ncbi:hypothetical protein HBB16_04460 [Pseudonocardia sp. MCCB 268]|nr:hypothetical protein [Pseudonocardia cytotoxica]
MRKALSTDNVGVRLQEGRADRLSVTFSAHYVSASIALFRIVDATA